MKNYDPRCEELAKLFLSDEPLLNNESKITELAKLIQITIEEFIDYERDQNPPIQRLTAG